MVYKKFYNLRGLISEITFRYEYGFIDRKTKFTLSLKGDTQVSVSFTSLKGSKHRLVAYDKFHNISCFVDRFISAVPSAFVRCNY